MVDKMLRICYTSTMENVIKQIVEDSTLILRDSKAYDLKNFSLNMLKIDPSPHRRGHLGGMYAKGPGISLSSKLIRDSSSIVKSFGFGIFKEYPSFETDAIIGSFFFKDVNHYLKGITTHEIAHAAQFFLMRKLKKEEDKDFAGHQRVFKDLYGLLRTKLINHSLEPQLPLKQEYQRILKEAKALEIDRVFCI